MQLGITDQLALLSGERKPYPLPGENKPAPAAKLKYHVTWDREPVINRIREAFGDKPFTGFDLMPFYERPVSRQAATARIQSLAKEGFVTPLEHKERTHQPYVLAQGGGTPTPKLLIGAIKKKVGTNPFTIPDLLGSDDNYSSYARVICSACKRGEVERIGKTDNAKKSGMKLTIYRFVEKAK
jgi:hypothetical protein